MSVMQRTIAAAALAIATAGTGAAVADEEGVIATAVLRVEHERPLPISRLDLPTEDLGFAGARVAVEDNNTTGAFMGQEFTLREVSVAPEEAADALEALLDDGVRFVATMADADLLLELAEIAGDRALLLNASAADDRLRGADCRANVLHLVPSRAMKTDALAQFLMVKQWPNWFLIEGSHDRDGALGEAYRRAATKFGARIVETRVYEDRGGARSTDAGTAQVQHEMPVFTQRAPAHDILIAADESQVFAAYLPFHTWDARLVAGSAGLRPTTWHPAHDAWGARQLQSRFERTAGRPMRSDDYNVWMALRVPGEAAQRANSTDFEALLEYIKGPSFELAVFKGQAATFRDWDNQLRQPILLANDNLVVTVSPQDAYVHQFSPLDTLGTDRPESDCSFD
jgi:ABC transporter substrate binding protein (PQQ-dependent alcohol dehydrogenase system)